MDKVRWNNRPVPGVQKDKNWKTRGCGKKTSYKMSVGCYQDPLGPDQSYLRDRKLHCLWSFLFVSAEAKIIHEWQFIDCPSPPPLLEHLRTSHSTLLSNACISQVHLQEETLQSQRIPASHRSCPRQRRRKLMCLKHLLPGKEERGQKARWKGEGLWIGEIITGVKRVKQERLVGSVV